MNSYENSVSKMIKETGLNRDEIIKLHIIFFETYQKTLAGIKNAIENFDCNQIIKDAHRLKGSSGNLRLVSIFEYASELEAAAKDCNLKLCAILFDKMNCELKATEISILGRLLWK